MEEEGEVGEVQRAGGLGGADDRQVHERIAFFVVEPRVRPEQDRLGGAFPPDVDVRALEIGFGKRG